MFYNTDTRLAYKPIKVNALPLCAFVMKKDIFTHRKPKMLENLSYLIVGKVKMFLTVNQGKSRLPPKYLLLNICDSKIKQFTLA